MPADRVPCKAEACEQLIKEGYGMCRRHWFTVPPALRKKIWESVGDHVLNAELWEEAIAAVKAKESEKAAGHDLFNSDAIVHADCRCSSCGRKFSVNCRMKDVESAKCPHCGKGGGS